MDTSHTATSPKRCTSKRPRRHISGPAPPGRSQPRVSPKVRISTPSTVPRCDQPRRRPSFAAVAGVAGALAAGLTRGDPQARVALARVAEQPPPSTATSLPVRTIWESLPTVGAADLRPLWKSSNSERPAVFLEHDRPSGELAARCATSGCRSASSRSSGTAPQRRGGLCSRWPTMSRPSVGASRIARAARWTAASVVDRLLSDTDSVGRVGTLCRQPARDVGLDASQMLWGCRPAGLGSACRRSARATHERRALEWGELAGDPGASNREELTGIATGCAGVPYADRAGGVGGHESAAV